MTHISQASAIIVADGATDLPDGFSDQTGTIVVPLMVRFGTEELRAGIDITPAEFYERLATSSVLPTTSQPTIGDYVSAFEEAGKSGLPILSFHLSSGLSGSIRSAQTARDMLPHLDIRLFDTGTLSAAMAMQVMVAADMAQQGIPVEEIVTAVEAIGPKSDLFFTLETLEHLRRGGRIGRVAGYVGDMLGIKPIVTVDKETGTYTAAGRARSFRKAINKIVDIIESRVGEGADVTCLVVHGDCQSEAQRLVKLLQDRFKCHWVQIVRSSPALGTHVGPKAIGIGIYAGKLPMSKWPADLCDDESASEPAS